MSNNEAYDGPIFAVYLGEYVYLYGEYEKVEFCGIPCIRGVTYPTGKNDWTGGLICCLPLASITKVHEYNSLDHYHQVMKEHYMRRAES